MIHRYLFFIRNNKVKVFRFKKHELHNCPRDGFSDFDFLGLADLWDWWKSFSSVTTKDTVDFLFVSDIKMDFTFSFTAHDTSVWGRTLLEDFFEQFCNAPKIDLHWESGSIIRIKDTPAAQFPKLVENASFFIFPPMKDVNIKYEDGKTDDILYHHFHDEIKKNRKRNNEK